MSNQDEIKRYDGSEMDEIKSPPLKMISVYLGLTALTFGYVYIWSFLLS